jgi:hypothetical protein
MSDHTAYPIVKVVGIAPRYSDGVCVPGYVLSLSCGHEAVFTKWLPEHPAVEDEIPCRACAWQAKGVDPKLDPGGEFDDFEEGRDD